MRTCFPASRQKPEVGMLRLEHLGFQAESYQDGKITHVQVTNSRDRLHATCASRDAAQAALEALVRDYHIACNGLGMIPLLSVTD